MKTKKEIIKEIYRLDSLVKEKRKKCATIRELRELQIIGEKIITLCETVL